MANKFNLTILTPERIFFQYVAEQIIIPTKNGALGVLHSYMNSITLIQEGIMQVTTATGVRKAAIGAGFMESTRDGIELYVNNIEWAEDIDVVRSEQALQRAEARLKQHLSHNDDLLTKAAIARATARLKAVK